jgi:hypothetical protein
MRHKLQESMFSPLLMAPLTACAPAKPAAGNKMLQAQDLFAVAPWQPRI